MHLASGGRFSRRYHRSGEIWHAQAAQTMKSFRHRFLGGVQFEADTDSSGGRVVTCRNCTGECFLLKCILCRGRKTGVDDDGHALSGGTVHRAMRFCRVDTVHFCMPPKMSKLPVVSMSDFHASHLLCKTIPVCLVITFARCNFESCIELLFAWSMVLKRTGRVGPCPFILVHRRNSDALFLKLAH